MRMKRKRNNLVKMLSGILVSTSLIVGGMHLLNDDKTPNYQTYTVTQGETLWSIAKSTNPEEDPREIVYLIRKENNITPIIKPGQTIKVPVFKEVVR